MRQIGIITTDVIRILNLGINPGTPIYLGETNITHMISKAAAFIATENENSNDGVQKN